MKRIAIGALAAAALVGAAACSQNGFAPVAVTTSPSVVASCEKIADVTVAAGRFDGTDVQTQMTREVRTRGGNTVLVASENATTGTAYRCAMPSVTGEPKASGSSRGH
jgi:hypothetical protein